MSIGAEFLCDMRSNGNDSRIVRMTQVRHLRHDFKGQLAVLRHTHKNTDYTTNTGVKILFMNVAQYH